MPMRVTGSPEQYAATITRRSGIISNKYAISPGTGFDRLSPSIKELYSTYPSIPYISAFISASYRHSASLTYSSLYLLIRLCVAIKKCLSGIEYEFVDHSTIEQEVFLAQLRMFVCMLESDLRTRSLDPHLTDTSDLGIRVEISHELEEQLLFIENWRLAETLVDTDTYVPLGISLSNYIGKFTTGANFIGG